ncbi:ubiquitin-associated UBA domain protein [Nitzschia inconspicua]|uniref:Ubiquitin-associated UBA domain protein n=1 Tax=Nitzschia inconspicua TaxID=303405 RepID=A0A9K3K8R9_9STRA|nr:ubiquitin-associated UBA domain protein [Nitzschia inconspicua]
MGYPAHQCTKALQVAEGDLEQAVEYLLMGDGSQQAFHYSATEMFSDGGADATAQTAEAPQIDQENEDFVSRRGSFTFSLQSTHRCETPLPRSPQVQLEEFLLIMGYSEDEITQALRVAEGDLEQAINFLLMGKSRQGFLLDVEHFSSEHSVQRNNMNISTGCGLGSDNPVTHIVQRVMTDGTNDIRALRTNIATTRPPSSNPLPYTGPKSKIVSTQSFLNVSAAGPFCTCFAGSRFLDGGWWRLHFSIA